MASITSLSNSSYNSSSIYGNRNVLSGLASGMDTEAMIENAVAGIKLKIENLVKKRTKVEWQQEAYRSIIDKAVNFNTKYTSYSSKTNLLSASFFNSAVNTTVNGTWKDKITASGKTSSDIKINAVKQMAKAATYTTSGLGGKFKGEINGIEGAKGLDLNASMDVSNISGSLSIQYGSGKQGASFTISFDELDDIVGSGQELADAINEKLADVTYTYTKNGFQESTTADKAVQAVYMGGEIVFKDVLGNGNKVSIGGVSGDMEDTLGISAGDTSISVNYDTKWSSSKTTAEYLEGKELGVTYNGTTKKISMDKVLERMGDQAGQENAQFQIALQEELDSAFGSGKITVDRGQDGKLSLTPSGEGDTLALGGTALKGLGFTEDNTNYVNTGKKLSELLGEDFLDKAQKLKAEGEVKNSADGKYSVDSKGNRVSKGEDGEYYRVDADGEFLYDFSINGANISVTKNTTLERLMNSINSSAEAGVKVSYSKLTNEFQFTASQTGASGRIEFGGLAKDMFVTHDREASDSFADTYGLGLSDGQSKRFAFSFEGRDLSFEISSGDSMQDVADHLNMLLSNYDQTASYDELTGQIMVTDKTGKMVDFELYEGLSSSAGTKIDRPEFESSFTSGQDAVMDVEINGKRFEDLTRSSNSFDLDGLTVNVKGTFEAKAAEDGKDYEPITFATSTDTDKIVDVIRQFVDDYNEMATEIKNQYSTLPAQKSNGAKYEPLTSEQEDQYSESELKAYYEKAKQGVLFGDTNLSGMYSKLLSAIAPGGTDGQTLREIGIGTSYSNGMTTLSLDEDKLRAALESDPDKVKNAFTKSKEGGSSSDGLMTRMQDTLNTYVKTTGEPKGILIQRAGSNKAYTSLNNNTLKTQIDNIDNQIERWQNKMASQIDRYTTQFSRLEQLIAEMNSQSSAMMGLMGGSSGY
ncbi:MAG: flagellar filament capping protein FliD [Oscillospiraceae bacterium]|jgi:flagellar hook-associated protein 2|nr:flagellar filament capping protein FliD [Oscillospiraceae bacterium]